MTLEGPSYRRQMWQYWRWRLVLLAVVCGACFAFIAGIHEMVAARDQGIQEYHRAH